jgi:hypothetical protein
MGDIRINHASREIKPTFPHKPALRLILPARRTGFALRNTADKVIIF